jgi:hypothetical protein
LSNKLSDLFMSNESCLMFCELGLAFYLNTSSLWSTPVVMMRCVLGKIVVIAITKSYFTYLDFRKKWNWRNCIRLKVPYFSLL